MVPTSQILNTDRFILYPKGFALLKPTNMKIANLYPISELIVMRFNQLVVELGERPNNPIRRAKGQWLSSIFSISDQLQEDEEQKDDKHKDNDKDNPPPIDTSLTTHSYKFFRKLPSANIISYTNGTDCDLAYHCDIFEFQWYPNTYSLIPNITLALERLSSKPKYTGADPLELKVRLFEYLRLGMYHGGGVEDFLWRRVVCPIIRNSQKRGTNLQDEWQECWRRLRSHSPNAIYQLFQDYIQTQRGKLANQPRLAPGDIIPAVEFIVQYLP